MTDNTNQKTEPNSSMKTIQWRPSFLVAAASLAWAATSEAAVTFVGNDLDTGPAWRTATAVKPNDLDGDNVYGTAGYYLAAGLRAGYEDPWLADNLIIGDSNDDDINELPDFITGLEFTDPAQHGRSWGGSGGNFGTLDNVGNGHTGQTGAAILLSPGGTAPMSLTLKRNNSPDFRLTLILGSANEGGFDDPAGQNVTVDDGTGAVSQAVPSPGFAAATTYQSWDISAGSSDITLVLQGLPEGVGTARMSGLTIDTSELTPPALAKQPTGGTFLAGDPLTLSVEAVGVQLSYQWFKDGAELPGETAATLTIPALADTDAGSYHVVVSNPAGSATSDPAVVTIAAGFPAAVTAYQAAVKTEPTLVSYYTFEGMDAADVHGPNDGTLVGSAGFGAGLGDSVDKALLLDGSGHVTFGQVDEFDFPFGVGTIEGWVRADWQDNAGYNPALWADRDGGPVNWSIHMQRGGKGSIMHWNGSAVATASIPAAGNEWHHLAMTFDLDTWSVFWDGQLVGSATQPFGPNFEAPTQLGSSSAGATTEGWMGALDEVAFYNDVLSEAAIQSHFNLILATRPPKITQQPQGGTFLAGIPLNLTVAAEGLNLNYQWYQDGTAVPGGTTDTLSLPSLAASDAGDYYVEVSNANGAAPSDTVQLAVEPALPGSLVDYRDAVQAEPSLISHYPFDDLTADDSVAANDGTLAGSALFAEGVAAGADKSVGLDGEGHVDLGQVADFDFLDGTGTIELFVRADWTGDPGYNPVIVADRDRELGLINYSFNLAGDKTQLIFFDGAVAQNVDLLVPAGEAWHLLAIVLDGPNSAFYWDGQLAGGFDASILGGSPESPTQFGSAAPLGQLRWIGALDEVSFFADPLSGTAIQNHYAAFLGSEPPTIILQPEGAKRFVGSPLDLVVGAQGTDLTYQWHKNGVAIPGANDATLSIPALAADDAGSYTVTVANQVGLVESDPAVVEVIVTDLATYQQAVQAEPGLISYYPFDAGDAFDVVGANHGFFEGDAAPIIGAGGGADQAVQMSGTGFVSFGWVDAFDFADGVGSVEAWVRADWTSSPGYNPTIFADRDGGVNWSIHLMAPKDRAAHWNGSGVAFASIPVAGTTWHHVVSTFNGTDWSVFWDGELAGTTTQAFGPDGIAATTQLGSASSTGQEQWIGAMDEAAFYSVALSPETVRAHYQALVGVPEVPPTLAITRNGNQVTIAWDAAAVGYTLVSTDALPATEWTPVDGVVDNSVTLDITSGARFYRLQKP